MLPDAVAVIDLDGDIEVNLSFTDGTTVYTDLYLFVGKRAEGYPQRFPVRIRRFMVPSEAATLVTQLRALAGLIESRTAATIASDGTVEREQSAGEIAHPNFVYRLADGTPLMGPCDTEGCKYASKPGGARHDGECSNAAFDAEKEQGA